MLQRAQASFEAAGNVRHKANVSVHVGFAHLITGAFLASADSLRSALVAAERLGLHYVAMTARPQPRDGARIQWRHRRWAENGTRGRSPRRAASTTHASQVPVLHYLALMHMLGDQPSQAEELAREAAIVLRDITPLRPYACATHSRTLVATGKLQQGLELARQAHEDLTSGGGVDEGEIAIVLSHAFAADAAGHQREAREALALARERLDKRAECISDAAVRDTFLANVPDHRTILRLGDEWR